MSERRDYSDFVKAAANRDYVMLDVVRGGAPVGFIGAWKFDGFLYVEHLATYPQYRNMGYGAAALKLLQNDNHVIVLEVEPPVTDMQKRRCEFYRRAGFVMNDCDYLQPPFRACDKPFPLKLMSYPAALNDKQSVIQAIYAKVYDTDYDRVLALYKKSRTH